MQASKVRRCSAAASHSAWRSLYGRVAEQTAALSLLERLLLGAFRLRPVGGGNRTKLGVCLACIGNLVFGKNFHGFDVEVEAMLRLGWSRGFADDRERVACLCCREIGTTFKAATCNDSNFELRDAR